MNIHLSSVCMALCAVLTIVAPLDGVADSSQKYRGSRSGGRGKSFKMANGATLTLQEGVSIKSLDDITLNPQTIDNQSKRPSQAAKQGKPLQAETEHAPKACPIKPLPQTEKISASNVRPQGQEKPVKSTTQVKKNPDIKPVAQEPVATTTGQKPSGTKKPGVRAPEKPVIGKPAEGSEGLMKAASHDHIQKLIKETDCLVLDVYTNWCGQCTAMEPALEKLAKKYDGKLLIVKVNAETAGAKFAKVNKVEGLPTYFFYKKGSLVHRSTGGSAGGMQAKMEAFEQKLKKAFPDL